LDAPAVRFDQAPEVPERKPQFASLVRLREIGQRRASDLLAPLAMLVDQKPASRRGSRRRISDERRSIRTSKGRPHRLERQ
jgi:hypothetical protein